MDKLKTPNLNCTNAIKENRNDSGDELEAIINKMYADIDPDEILNEILTPFELLSDLVIDWFIINLINNKPEIPYNMTPVLFAQAPEKYKPASNETDQIQKIFSGNIRHVGHYILAHYVAKENVVNIYDSLWCAQKRKKNRLTKSSSIIISNIFPGKKIAFVEPATKQPDLTSCGVFAIAYATLIALGENPATFKFQLVRRLRSEDKTILLRRHIAFMFCSRKLCLFPTEFN